jgi:hypothetical protein
LCAVVPSLGCCEPLTLLLLLLLLLPQVIEDVDKDRRYAIDAAIVRTMKSRKVGGAWLVPPTLIHFCNRCS